MADKIAINGVRKSYVSGKLALPVVGSDTFGVTLGIADGEFVALVGPSGCGKSTLMKIVSGFERADAGEVLIDGRPQVRQSPKGIVISQHGAVFPWLTVRQNG